RPITRRRVLSSKGEPYERSMRPATMAASLALATAKKRELQKLRSPSRLATMVAAITPKITRHRAEDCATIKVPEATPAAGQNTATPSGFSSRARLRRADRKYASAIDVVATTDIAHGGSLASGLRTAARVRSGSRTILLLPAKTGRF